ncbi:MAG TPA: PQQ-binding-like beta-propeller repeat protein [Opitutaceae bacterium]|nr:PQQ-binding-like beta-propeller repeat protein [Opitutaceae bacterium]
MTRGRQHHSCPSIWHFVRRLTAVLLIACGVPLSHAQKNTRNHLPEYLTIPAAGPDELTPAQPIDIRGFTTWTRSQGDMGSRRYSALKQITQDNVAQLAPAWTYHSRDGARNIQATPIIVDGVLYGPTAGRNIVALNAATGQELWRFKIERVNRPRLEDEPARRGLVHWKGQDRHPARLLFGSGNWIYALDPRTGSPISEFGSKGRTPIPTGATVSGVVHKQVFVTAGLYGDIYGYDVRSGAEVWRFHTVPHEGEFGADTWKGVNRSVYQANCWAGLSLDESRGIIFAAIGAAQPNFIGIDRHGDNLFSNCVVALDAQTGKRLWHFQAIRHDIWDLDNATPPTLVTLNRDGRRIDAVTCATKGGLLLLLNRTSGKPIFPFRLRRAPVSNLPGELTAEYQPDPLLPEPLSSPEFKLSDITQRSPEAHAFVLAQVQRANYGWFEPFSDGKATLFQGTRGGGEWSGSAVDLSSGHLYVTSNRVISKVMVFSSSEGKRDPNYPPSNGEKLYQQSCMACHGEDRLGTGMIPPLIGLRNRMNDNEVTALLLSGKGAMPPAPPMSAKERQDLLDFLFRRNQPPTRLDTRQANYAFDGFNFLVDHEGYPGINPPWGLLNCYDLNTGRILWRVPLGNYPELAKQGITGTGAQNLGGATVTAGGLVFCAGTPDEMIRAFSTDTGKELWKAKLPFAGYAAPAVYEVDGRQFVVVAATGGGKVGGPQGDAYVAFALPL